MSDYGETCFGCGEDSNYDVELKLLEDGADGAESYESYCEKCIQQEVFVSFAEMIKQKKIKITIVNTY